MFGVFCLFVCFVLFFLQLNIILRRSLIILNFSRKRSHLEGCITHNHPNNIKIWSEEKSKQNITRDIEVKNNLTIARVGVGRGQCGEGTTGNTIKDTWTK